MVSDCLSLIFIRKDPDLPGIFVANPVFWVTFVDKNVVIMDTLDPRVHCFVNGKLVLVKSLSFHLLERL